MLAFEWVGNQTLQAETVVMLHGILGRRRNLLGFARRFAAKFPKYKVLVIDLRNHGESQGFKGPHTLAACAKDLTDLFQNLAISPRSLIGHSFGAGVACAYAKAFNNVESLWLLDAIPAVAGRRPLDPDIDLILKSIEFCTPTPSKKDFEGCLLSKGITPALVSWLSMNLSPNGDQLHFRPDPKVAREMIEDLAVSYRLADFNSLKTKIFLIKAERNDGWKGPIADRLPELISAGLIEAFDLPNSGHFVHIDNPEGIMDAMMVDFA